MTRDADVGVGRDTTFESGRTIALNAGHTVVLIAGSANTDTIELRTGSASIVMNGKGEISIHGTKITIQSDGDLILKGAKIVN